MASPAIHIQTIGRSLRRTRVIKVIAVPCEMRQDITAQWTVWAYGHEWNGRRYNLLRSWATLPIFPTFYSLITQEPLPVSQDERERWLESPSGRSWLRTVMNVTEEQIDNRIRAWRGDPNQIKFIFEAPIGLDHEAAASAGALDLTSEHLFCGVSEVNGRWTYHVGRRNNRREIGAADTQAEAWAMAQAHLWKNWLERVEHIKERRGGDLSWGIPLPIPTFGQEQPAE